MIEERNANSFSGWLFLPVWLALLGVTLWLTAGEVVFHGRTPTLTGILGVPLTVLAAKGFIVLPPNIGAVLTFFGRYAGSLREDGFFWVNPLCVRQRVSLRVNNLNTPILKVNDRAGNPIELGAVVVWRVADSARAVFDVQDYAAYIATQSESALRAVASSRWYDGDEQGRNSLRADLDAVSEALAETIQEHVALAGLDVIQARIAHLAYAPEIASAMLRRQQAAAVVAARTQIVEGAVGMVRLAIEQLEREGIVHLGEAERIRLVGNLMTVLVSESETHPVIAVDKASG